MRIEGSSLFEWQQDVYNCIKDDNYKYHTVVTSRQIGKSTLATNLLLDFLINNKGSNVGVVSLTYRQVKVIYDTISNLMAKTKFVKSDNKSDTQIVLINGSTIRFFSAQNADALRGFTFTHLVLDEAAFFGEELWQTILQPTVLVRGEKVVMFSTPKGDNWFKRIYDLGTRGNNDYISFKYDYTNSPFLDEDEINFVRQSVPDMVFQQEYLCRFVDSASVFKGLSNICVLDSFAYPEAGRQYVMGFDVALTHDWSVITVIRDDGHIVDVYRDRTVSIIKLYEEAEKMLKRWKPFKCVLELNNVGRAVYDHLAPKYRCIEPFTTTAQTKGDLINGLIYAIEKEAIKLPTKEFYKPMFQELTDFTFNISPKSKTIQYSAPSGLHDDCVISLALAVRGFSERYMKSKPKVRVFFG